MARAVFTPQPARRFRTSISHALPLVGIVWGEVYVLQGLWPNCGGTAFAFSLALVTVEVDVLRRQEWSQGKRPEAPRTNRASSFAAYAIAGVLLQPWLAFVTIEIHSAVAGAGPRLSPTPPHCIWHWVSTLVLAPLFEERLYREALLGSLQPRIGAFGGVVVSSLAFAIPHTDSLSIAGTFLAGLVLGGTAIRTRRVAPCIALHFGFNLAAVGAATFGSAAP